MTSILRVSDHAVLRFLERHDGVDVEGARERIRAIVQPFYAGMAKQGLTTKGFQFLINDGVVVTCYPATSGRIVRLEPLERRY